MVGCLVAALVGVVAVITALLSPRVWIALAFAAVLAFAGIQTMRLNHAHTEYAFLQAQIAEERAKAEADARATEQKWQDQANQLGATKDAEIRDIGSKLDAALASLRNRPSRPAGDVPSTASTCKGATGAGIYAQDAELLVREAARADRLRAALIACYQTYDAIRR